MLRSDRVDLIVITRFALKHILDKYQESLDEYQIVWQISRVENYFAFHKDTPDIFINTFQQAFDSTVVERTARKRRYKLPDEEF